MMEKNLHTPDAPQKPANQNNQMSEDPKDGSRTSFTLGKDGTTPVEKKPPNDAQDEATVEDFGREGMGVGAKE